MTSKSDLVSTDRIIFVACDYVDAQTVFGLHLIQRLQSLQNEKDALVNCRYPQMFIFGLFVYVFSFFFFYHFGLYQVIPSAVAQQLSDLTWLVWRLKLGSVFGVKNRAG